MNNIQKTIEYVQTLFNNSEYLKDRPMDKQYRLDHTFRVASIGKKIAKKENLNVEATVIGCLLHDISYIYSMETKDDWLNHGRKAAEICKDFVLSLDMEDKLKHELLYGIAIHVDDKSNFEGERTILAETIGEADNIDRFDKFRLYEALLESDLKSMTLDNQIAYAENKIKRLTSLKKITHKTVTSNQLWKEKLDYQIEYFHGLLQQLKTSNYSALLDI
ncbi:MAG: HD domain-containing protein [Bacilli bacterium]|nr:HD domain-containing protein [Bacilli bacterium]